MKFQLALAACLVANALAVAQGTVTFANTTLSLVRWGSRPENPLALQGQPVLTEGSGDYRDFRVALYWLNPVTSAFEPLGSPLPIAPVEGRFSGGIRATGIGTPPGATGTFLVRAWSHGSVYSSWEAVLASGDSRVATGETVSFSNPTGGAGAPPLPASPLSGFGGLNVNVVPEPSALMLVAVGGLALLMRPRTRPVPGSDHGPLLEPMGLGGLKDCRREGDGWSGSRPRPSL